MDLSRSKSFKEKYTAVVARKADGRKRSDQGGGDGFITVEEF